MRDCDVVVLSRFPEIFAGFQNSVDGDAPELYKKAVWDRESKNMPAPGYKWTFTLPCAPFHMAFYGNVALGKGEHDVLYAGDDTRIIEPETIKRLQALAYSDPRIGILSPRIVGHAQAEQMQPTVSPITFAPFVAFVFVYIKREVIDAIGYLDERFEGYGMEDIDYCYRARLAGFKIGVAKDIAVKHGVNGHSYGSTFLKVKSEREMGQENLANITRFAEKWGIKNDVGDVFREIENPSRGQVVRT